LTNFSWGGETAGTGPTKGQPTIFALNQLYADTVANGGCQTSTQAVPAAYWSYNTGIGAVADLSPVLSFYDGGKQVAFMQRTAAASSLVLLKWSSASAGTMGMPTSPTSVTPANYRACTAPCMTTFALGANNTNSAPYVDYFGDAIYVGDDIGRLHRFTGVFIGTPAAAGAPWPVQAAPATSVMSSPVFDGTSTVYAGSNGPDAATGNKLHRINTATERSRAAVRLAPAPLKMASGTPPFSIRAPERSMRSRAPLPVPRRMRSATRVWAPATRCSSSRRISRRTMWVRSSTSAPPGRTTTSTGP
jgi:hypothetical protein